MSTPGMDTSERLYRLLLRTYPTLFRERYGVDAVEAFRDQYVDAYERDGAAGCARLWMRTVPSVIAHGFRERIAAGRRSGDGLLPAIGRAVRTMARSPGASALPVLTLALGIGANVALFSVLRGVLIRPLPFPESGRLVRIWETNPAVDDARHGPSPLNFADWEQADTEFESMAAWYVTSGTFRGDFGAEEIRSAQVTSAFFRVLGVEPAIGRDFRSDEVVRYGPIMLSDRAWWRLFGGDPGVVGRTIVASNRTYEIVGVMPPDFAFPDASVETWIAWDLPTVYRDQPESRTWRFLEGIGRLRPGVGATRAEAGLDAVAARLAELHPAANAGWDVSLRSLHEDITGDVRGTLWLAFGAVLFLLLMACANVANLLLARVPARRRVLAIRSALGASRRRILGDLLADNLMLAGAGGVLGVGMGALLLRLLVAFDAGRIPRLADVGIDGWVLAFALAAAAGTSLVFGVAPVLATLRGSTSGSLRDGTRTAGSRGQRRLRTGLVAAQVAVALVLLTGAALFRASFEQLVRVDPGFDPANVATFRVSLDPVEGDPDAAHRYYSGLLERIEALPGVVRAGAAQSLPLNPVGNDFQRPYRLPGTRIESADAPTAQLRIVTSGYMDAMRMRVIDGTAFSGNEAAGQPLVALANRTLARRLWPAGGAVGEWVELDFRDGWQAYRVIGVIEDVRHYGPREAARPELYISHRQVPYLAMSVVVRTTGDPAAMTETLSRTVRSHLPLQPAHAFVTLDALRRASVAEERFLLVLFGVFSAIALSLACMGVYGVVSYAVSQSTREIGVRMALGARSSRVLTEVLRHAAAMAAIGLIAGFIVLRLVGRAADSVLYGVSARDPLATVTVALLMLVVSLIAAWAPARRAARIPPVTAMRAD